MSHLRYCHLLCLGLCLVIDPVHWPFFKSFQPPIHFHSFQPSLLLQCYHYAHSFANLFSSTNQLWLSVWFYLSPSCWNSLLFKIHSGGARSGPLPHNTRYTSLFTNRYHWCFPPSPLVDLHRSAFDPSALIINSSNLFSDLLPIIQSCDWFQYVTIII